MIRNFKYFSTNQCLTVMFCFFSFLFHYENKINKVWRGEFAFSKPLFTTNDSGHANNYWPLSYPPKAPLALHVIGNSLVAKFWNFHSRYWTRLKGKHQIFVLVIVKQINWSRITLLLALCWESYLGYRWIPSQRTCNAERVPMFRSHHCVWGRTITRHPIALCWTKFCVPII